MKTLNKFPDNALHIPSGKVTFLIKFKHTYAFEMFQCKKSILFLLTKLFFTKIHSTQHSDA